MDRASRALIQGVPPGVPKSYRALADHGEMSDLGKPIRIKDVASLGSSVTRCRSTDNRPNKHSGKNWARALEKRYPEIRARRFRALDWKRHEKNTYEKTSH
ncbi:hypothetical protein MRB53_041946 [Persea americana]|nr:hypothetical protein MRB53_041946 [Persea americana]